MAGAIGDAGEVAVVVHDQTSRTGIDRRDGFLEKEAARRTASFSARRNPRVGIIL